jgi:ribosomal protein S27AE
MFKLNGILPEILHDFPSSCSEQSVSHSDMQVTKAEPWFTDEKRTCPKCGSPPVIEIANQLHCQMCAFDYAVQRNVARKVGSVGMPKRVSK